MSRLLSRTRLALPAQVARSQVSCVRYESTRTSKEDQPATGGSNVQGSQAGATGLTEVEPAREVVSADVISGVPEDMRRRGVRIFKPTKSSMQSGKHSTHHWRLDFDIVNQESKWENPLMGWASSSDAVQGTHVKFDSKEDAIHFAEKQGWDYFVQEPHEPVFRRKSYSNNFLYSPGKLRQIKTK